MLKKHGAGTHEPCFLYMRLLRPDSRFKRVSLYEGKIIPEFNLNGKSGDLR